MKLNDIQELTRYFGLWVGESGDGKSCAAASFPKPIYYIDLDDRIKGVIAAKEWLGSLDGIEYDRFKGYADIEKKLDQFLATYNATRKFPYATIVFDSLTAGSRAYVNEGVRLGAAGDTSDANASPRRLGTVLIPGFNAYNYESIAHYNVILAYLKAFPCNVIINGHKAPRYDKKGEMIGVELLGRPKISAEIPTYFDEVYEFSRNYNSIKRSTEYMVQFRGDLAKTALQHAPFGQVDITKQNFYEILQQIQKGEFKGRVIPKG